MPGLVPLGNPFLRMSSQTTATPSHICYGEWYHPLFLSIELEKIPLLAFPTRSSLSPRWHLILLVANVEAPGGFTPE